MARRVQTYKTPLEIADALRTAVDWVMNPRKVRIRGRIVRRAGGAIIGRGYYNEQEQAMLPMSVCLLGAAKYALDGPGMQDDTTDAVLALSRGKRALARDLEVAWQQFDQSMELGGRRSKEGSEALALSVAAITRVAEAMEAEVVKETAPEPKVEMPKLERATS